MGDRKHNCRHGNVPSILRGTCQQTLRTHIVFVILLKEAESVRHRVCQWQNWNSNSAQFCCEREIKQTRTKCKRNQIVENI